MASKIIEFFGYGPEDRSPVAVEARQNLHCPFLVRQCSKTLNNGLTSGACTLKPVTSGPVISAARFVYTPMTTRFSAMSPASPLAL